MQRHAIGLIALVALIAGSATLGAEDAAFSGTCLRIGAVLALLWLALPQLQGVPRWLVAVGGGALLLIMYRPKLLWAVLPLAVVLWLLRPRPSRRRPLADPRD